MHIISVYKPDIVPYIIGHMGTLPNKTHPCAIIYYTEVHKRETDIDELKLQTNHIMYDYNILYDKIFKLKRGL